MGLFDFLKKGEEKPVAKQEGNSQPTQARPAASNTYNSNTQGAAPTSAQPQVYTVKSGDSLSKIAKQFYGDASQWKKIHQANLDKIKNPDLIHPGAQLVIPK